MLQHHARLFCCFYAAQADAICQRPTQRLEVQFLGLAIGPWAPKFINISNTLIKGKGKPLLS
ncbi:hypothetical protein NC652_001370 [Populus alba x Populus x berolinensis]|nr:hypothetical protein NC652_001370 [Populus alba x Populus x berolinensis]